MTYLDMEVKRNGFVPGSTKYEVALDMIIKNRKSDLNKGKRRLLGDDIATANRINPVPGPNAHKVNMSQV